MAGRNTVEIILSASDRASGAIRGAFGTLEQSNSRAMGALKVGAGLAATAFAALGGYIAKVGVGYDAMQEQSQVAWNTLLGSQEKAKKMLMDIANFAKATPFETESVDMMAKYMHNAGLEGKGLFDSLMKISDVSSAFAIPAESAVELTRQMSQVRQAGVAYTEDLNVLQDRGVPIYKAIASQLGITTAEVKKMASQGKLSSDIYIKAFNGVADSVKGASDAQSKTFSGMMSTLTDSLKMISGELAKPLFEKMKQGLDALLPVLNGVLALAKGDFKSFSDTMTSTFGGSVGGMIVTFAQQLGQGFQMVSHYVDMGKQSIKALFDFLSGDNIGGISILTKMGLSTDMIVKINNVLNSIKQAVSQFFGAYVEVAQFELQNLIGFFKGAWDFIKGIFSGDNALGQSFAKIFNTIKSIVMPILNDAVAFIKEKFAMIKQFWDENGAQIIQAVKNFVAVLAAIFQFIAPVILFIIKMLWDNVKGVIDGALKIIMGLIKVFAGLFTGDFGKMWEGIKQIFFGAIQAVWNLINLLMFGRILGGIKAFVVKGGEFFAGLGPKLINVVKNLDNYLFDFVRSMFSKLVSLFQGFVNGGVRIFGTLRTFGASIFQSLWAAVRTIAGNIASSVTGHFNSLVSGAKSAFNGLLSGVKTTFSAIKNAITNPIETAKTLVGKAIDAIKGFFSNMKVKIPLPHFNFSAGHTQVAGISVPYPKLNVDWYDKGGVFTGPQVIGVGEKRPEFVGALDDLRKIVREESNSSNPSVNITLNYNGSGSESDAYTMVNIIEHEMSNRLGIKSILNGVK